MLTKYRGVPTCLYFTTLSTLDYNTLVVAAACSKSAVARNKPMVAGRNIPVEGHSRQAAHSTGRHSKPAVAGSKDTPGQR